MVERRGIHLQILFKKVKKIATFLYRHLPLMTRSGLQFEVAYFVAMTLGGAAQVAAAHCPNERTLDPAVGSYNRPTHAPASCTMAFTPQCSHYF